MPSLYTESLFISRCFSFVSRYSGYVHGCINCLCARASRPRFDVNYLWGMSLRDSIHPETGVYRRSDGLTSQSSRSDDVSSDARIFLVVIDVRWFHWRLGVEQDVCNSLCSLSELHRVTAHREDQWQDLLETLPNSGHIPRREMGDECHGESSCVWISDYCNRLRPKCILTDYVSRKQMKTFSAASRELMSIISSSECR